MFYNVLFVALGGALGSVARFLISKATQSVCTLSFPIATLIVNVLGCFIIGLLYAIFERNATIDSNIRLMLTVGFCGGFTTFSTFINENFNLIGNDNFVVSAIYIGLSVVLGFIGVWLGAWVIRAL
ncbi:MAG: fluoride efflux transporter CrcB [Bacteroidales bacterium]|nr:fluoride efflux transporter CrcB [Bacteroidales bacterium]MCR5697590.1 fluoride efflux transporter CrcB [Marinilabiliaceae bacterium]